MIKLTNILNEAVANPATKKFLKGMQSIKVNGLGGYMPGVKNVYWDKKDKKFYFVDFEGDYMEVKNISTLKQLDSLIKKSNIKLEYVNEGVEPEIITQLRDVMKSGYKSIKDPKSGKKMKVDTFSASAIVGVYDKLNPSNQEKFVKQGLIGMQSLAFKVLNK
jgi:hypothetical protein